MMASTLIKNGQIVTEQGVNHADILIENNTITNIERVNELTSNESQDGKPFDEIIDATSLLIFPGLIDCHVHFREPGNEDAEDMITGSESAQSGGVTTVCEMPNTSPPACTVEALEEKIQLRDTRHKTQDSRAIDIRFFFGVTKLEHLEELKKVNREDICGVKLYLGQSTGNQKVESGITEEVFKTCAELDLPLVCHCEDEGIIQENLNRVCRGAPLGRPGEEKSSAAHLHTIEVHSEIRSVEAAVASTTFAIELAKKYGTKLHIAHVSTSDEIELINQAKRDGINITCEVAPHHLFLSVDD